MRQMTFNRATKTPLSGIRIVSSQMVLGKMNIHMQKNKTEPLSYIIYKKLKMD